MVVGHKIMIRDIFDRLYELANSFVLEVSQGEALEYYVDNARLSDGLVSFTKCIHVPLYTRYKHRFLELYNNDIGYYIITYLAKTNLWRSQLLNKVVNKPILIAWLVSGSTKK